MRILIPGGTGFLGSLLAKEWAAGGHDVVVLSRHPDRARPAHPAVHVLEWDGRTAAGWAAEADGADAIVNLAGESIGGVGTLQILFQRWSPEKKKRILESRLNAGRAIVQAVGAVRHKPKVLLQNGGIGYYGPVSTAEIDESSAPGSDFLAGVVQAWEASTAPVESMGVRRIRLRTGLVLGRRGGTLPMMLLPFRLWAGGPLGDGRQPVPWVHWKDVAGAASYLLARSQSSGVYNLVAPDIVTNREFGRAVGRQMHRPFWLPVPPFALRGLLGEKATLILDGQRALPRRLVQEGFRFSFPDLRSALADLLG